MRIFNTYGPRMKANDGRVVSNLICQALQNKPLTIYGDGLQTRSFCYVDDLIDGMFNLMKSNTNSPTNIGNPEEITILELAKKIKGKINPKLEIVFKPLPQDDPIKRKPDITKAKSNLEWRPKISLDNGLDKTVSWFKNLLDD